MSSKSSSHIICNSIDETQQHAYTLASLMKEGDTLLLVGQLGAGKTTFTKFLIQALTKTPLDSITSPTFNYLNLYEQTSVKCAHFDLYRIDNLKRFHSMGLDEYLEPPYISIVEWPEILLPLLKNSYYQLSIKHLSPTSRSFSLELCNV